MQDYADQVEQLLLLGLTKYQARTYLALLDLVEAKASGIALVSGVPRGRIYEVLEGLHAAGLVEFIPSVPRQYRAIPLRLFLEKKKKALRAEADQLERSMGTLTSQFTPRQLNSTEVAGEFLVYRKRKAVMAKMREMVEGSITEVYVTASEGDAVRARNALLDVYQERAGAGVNLRMACNITRHNLDALKTLESAVQIRHQDRGNEAVTIMVVDKAQALFCHWTPDDGELLGGDHAAVWSDDIGIVRSLRSIVDEAWERGVEASLRYREIETGEPQRTELVARDALKASILDCIDVGLVVVDIEGRFLHFNRAGANIVGIGATSATLQEWPERYGIFRPDEATPFPAEELPESLALKGQTAQHVPLFVRNPQRPQGVHILATSRPLRDVKGRVQGAVTVFDDITELKRAEEAIEAERDFARSVIATVRTPLLVLDGDLRVVSANQSFYATFRVAEEETVGSLVYELGNRQWDIPPLRSLLAEVLSEGSAFEDFELEHRFERIGRRVMVLNARGLQREAQDERLILLALEDVTERKRAEEALQTSEYKIRAVLETARDAIISADSKGRIVSLNRRVETMFGYSAEKFIGKPLTRLIPRRFREPHRKWLKRLTGKTVELVGLRKDGSEFPLELSLSTWSAQEETFYTAIIRDITKRKRTERFLQGSELGRLSANHENTKPRRRLRGRISRG